MFPLFHASSQLTFSGLGEFMSQKEAKALICMISQLYRFERVTEGEIKPYFTIVSPASTPVEMRVLERE